MTKKIENFKLKIKVRNDKFLILLGKGNLALLLAGGMLAQPFLSASVPLKMVINQRQLLQERQKK